MTRLHTTPPKNTADVTAGDTIPVTLNGAKLYVRVTDVKRSTLRVDVYGTAQVFDTRDGTLRPVKVKVVKCGVCGLYACTCKGTKR